LRPLGDQDARCVRSTSATRTKLRVPVPRAFLVSLCGLRRRLGREEFGLRANTTREGSVSRRSPSLRRVLPGTRSSRAGGFTRLTRPRAYSTLGARGDRASDTPVAPPSPPSAPDLRPWVATRSCSHEARRPVRREKPRSPGPCSRERARYVTTRGAFHHQGALPRIRWRGLSRGPPRPHDPRASFDTREPPSGALTPPRDFAGPAPWFHGAARFSFALSQDAEADRATPCDADCRRPRRARSPFTRAGPLFGGRHASLFETRRRLTTSATATTYEH